MTKETMDAIAFWANIGTLIALLLNAVALFLAAWQIKIGRSGASAGALIALNESFRQAWLQFTNASNDDAKHHAFADVVNLLETACAVFKDKLFVGSTRELLKSYLCEVFVLIENSEDGRRRLESLFTTPDTFKHMVGFLSTHREQVTKIRKAGRHST
jgi:hypothetical protein